MNPAAERVIREAGACGSLAVSGLAKNAGKTETLLFLIDGLHKAGIPTGVTSIGIDGESTDQVTGTPKPEIRLYRDTLFATSETHYRQRRIQSEVLHLGRRSSPLGRVAIGRSLGEGKILISGPSDSPGLVSTIGEMQRFGAATVLVDGALSRQSLASPAVCSGMVLATGAAVSRTVRGVAQATGHLLRLMALPAVSVEEAAIVAEAPKGITALADGKCLPLGIPTALAAGNHAAKLYSRGTHLVVNGAVTDRLLGLIAAQPRAAETELTVRDFTCIFATREMLNSFLASGANLTVARRPRLIALSANPVSPEGFRLDAAQLRAALEAELLAHGFDAPLIDPVALQAETV